MGYRERCGDTTDRSTIVGSPQQKEVKAKWMIMDAIKGSLDPSHI
jgi:hypothetical protein